MQVSNPVIFFSYGREGASSPMKKGLLRSERRAECYLLRCLLSVSLMMANGLLIPRGAMVSACFFRHDMHSMHSQAGSKARLQRPTLVFQALRVKPSSMSWHLLTRGFVYRFLPVLFRLFSKVRFPARISFHTYLKHETAIDISVPLGWQDWGSVVMPKPPPETIFR